MRKLHKLTVIIPCFNEEETLRWTHERVWSVLKEIQHRELCAQYEILYINDGSIDQTQRILDDIFIEHHFVRALQLEKNVGMQQAIIAGLSLVQADAVITTDADLQDPPEKMIDMVLAYQMGYNLVLGVRKDRSSDSLFKMATAHLFYKCMQMLGSKIVYNHAEFRLMSIELVQKINSDASAQIFLRASLPNVEKQYTIVSYDRVGRLLGTTKFTMVKMLAFAYQGFTSISLLSNLLVLIRNKFKQEIQRKWVVFKDLKH